METMRRSGKCWSVIKDNYKSALIIGLLFSLIDIAGERLVKYDSLEIHSILTLKNVPIFITTFAFYFVITDAVLYFFTWIKTLQSRNFRWNYGVIAVLLFSLWGIWYILMWPGVVTYDSYNQIAQAMGWVALADNNPMFHTMLMACVIRPIYFLTKSMDFAIAGWILFSLLVYLLIVLYSIKTITTLISNKLVMIFVVLFYGVNPLVGFYNVVMWKDIWIANFTILFTVSSINYLYRKRNDLQTIVVSIIATMGVLYFKGTGIIIVGCSLLVFLLWYRKKAIRFALILFACIVVYRSSIVIATQCFDVQKHNSADALTIVWQPFARIIKEHKTELPEETLNELKEFIDVDSVENLYDSKIVDAVRNNCIHCDLFKKNIGRYMRLYMELALEYPMTYLDAVLTSSYGYWYPKVYYPCFSSASYYNTVKTYAENWNICFDPNYTTYDFNKNIRAMDNRQRIVECLEQIRHIPGLNVFLTIGSYFEMYILCFTFCLKRNKEVIPFFAIPLCVFVSCMMSPVYAEMRYAYPAIICFPLMIAITITPKRIEKDT